MVHSEFWIPKINAPIVCHTSQGEKLSGDIFLDVILTEGYNFSQIIDYFNLQAPFFPIRTPEAPLLLARESVVLVDIPQLTDQFRQDTASFGTRKDAMVHLHSMGPVRLTVVVDLPAEHSRVLDLVNLTKRTFFPALLNNSLSLVNIRHIYKIEEV